MSAENEKKTEEDNSLVYKGRIMYPPRPKLSIPPEKIPDYEEKGYVAQLKFNGTRTLIEIKPGGEILLWTRHREPHKAYELSEDLRAALAEVYENACKQDKHLVIDGELLNNKTKGLKDKFVAFDLLVIDDHYLVGESMLNRYTILDDILGTQWFWEEDTGRKIAIYCRDNLWLAELFMPAALYGGLGHNLSDVYSSRIDMDEIEGIVLKNPNATLERGYSENNNENWLVRCRKPNKNYKF